MAKKKKPQPETWIVWHAAQGVTTVEAVSAEGAIMLALDFWNLDVEAFSGYRAAPLRSLPAYEMRFNLEKLKL